MQVDAVRDSVDMSPMLDDVKMSELISDCNIVLIVSGLLTSVKMIETFILLLKYFDE